MSGGDWASFGGNQPSGENKQDGGGGGGDWAGFGGFEKSTSQSTTPQGGQVWAQGGQPQPGVTPPPPSGRSRASMRDRPLPITPPSQPANQSNTPGGGAPGINPTHALQLQQYRQRLQQMHQQLSAGQNQLKELQKNPQDNQAKIAQLTQQLQVGVGQYQKLHQVATQLQQQLIQQQQPGQASPQLGQAPPTSGGQTPPQSGQTPPTPGQAPPKDQAVEPPSVPETKPPPTEDAFTAFEDSNKTTPTPPPQQTPPMKAEKQDFFASFDETPPTQTPQSQAPPLQPQPNSFTSSQNDLFGQARQSSVQSPVGSNSSVVDQERVNQVEAEKKRLTEKLATSEGKISILEQEKLQILKDHESLVRSKEDFEKQLDEQKIVSEQQMQRFQDADSRHKTELEQIRKAGHDALAIIVEEYKEQTRLVVQQEREKAERMLSEALAKETEKCQDLLQKQHDRLLAAVEEEREKNEQKINEVIEKANQAHKTEMDEAMTRAEKLYQEKLQEALRNEQDSSTAAIRQASEEERKKTSDLLDQLKNSQKEDLEQEKEKHIKDISSAIEQERERSKDLLKEALVEERKKNDEAIGRVVERTQMSVQAKMEDIATAKEAANQRQLMGLDLFLSGAKSQLQSLMSTQSSPPSAVSSSLGHTRAPVEDGNKSVVTSSSVADAGDDFGSSFGPSTTANTSEDNAFTPSTNFDDIEN